MDNQLPEEYHAKPIPLPYVLPTGNNWYQLSSEFYHPLQAGSIDGTDLIPHDNGIVRAIMSDYRPNKLVQSDARKTLFACHFDRSTTEKTIHDLFIKYGRLQSCRLVRDFITGFSKGYAFIEYERGRDARAACREAHKAIVDGREIFVDFECERMLKGWKPRRFGGGLGGKKESGQLRFGGKGRPFRRPIDVDKNPLHKNNLRYNNDGGNQYNRNQSKYGNYEHRRR